jgi:GntR family transcriptional regulator, transcriptional repressor for pyruvate dehydrogenase complex
VRFDASDTVPGPYSVLSVLVLLQLTSLPTYLTSCTRRRFPQGRQSAEHPQMVAHSALHDHGDSAEVQVPRAFGNLSSRTLSERVSQEIIKSIVRGDFTLTGSLPSDNELAKQFDVSRPVVREAVKAVAMLGLISRRQGRATRIAPESDWRQLAPELLIARTETGRTEIGSIDDILLELLELRRIIEVEASALAGGRATDEDIRAMRQHLEMMDASLNDPDAFTHHDLCFHNAVLTAAGNHLLPPLFQQLHPLLEFARRLSLVTRQGGLKTSQDGHRAVFDAVLAGDSELARKSMADHLSWTANLDFSERERRLEGTHRRHTQPRRGSARS